MQWPLESCYHAVIAIHIQCTTFSQVKKAKKSYFEEAPPPQETDINFTDMNLSRPLLKVWFNNLIHDWKVCVSMYIYRQWHHWDLWHLLPFKPAVFPLLWWGRTCVPVLPLGLVSHVCSFGVHLCALYVIYWRLTKFSITSALIQVAAMMLSSVHFVCYHALATITHTEGVAFPFMLARTLHVP